MRSGIKHLPFLLKRTAHSKDKIIMDFDKKKPQSSIGHDVITGFCPVNLVQNGYQKSFKMAQPTKKITKQIKDFEKVCR